MKRVLKWIVAAVAAVVLLPLLLAMLLYVPPVQNWAVKQVAAIASDKTGMQISVDNVRLRWPLDLELNGLTAIHEGDTLADVGQLVADVQLRPLIDKRVVINKLGLNKAKLNTNGFISDLQIKGQVGELWLRSDGIDLEGEQAVVNGARIADSHLNILLSDTAAVDTTESTIRWKIMADSISITRTGVALYLPGDTMNIKAYMGKAVARQTDIDLLTSTYTVESLDWTDGSVAYNNTRQPTVDGLDANHIEVSQMTLGVDSLYYGPQGTRLYVRQAAMKEKSGLELTRMQGGVIMDTAFSHVTMPYVVMSTKDSDIEGTLDMDLNAFDDQNPGKLSTRLNAQIGKQDLIRFMSDMPKGFVRQYPNHPLTVKGSLNGNLQRMEFRDVDITLPTALHLTADGTAYNLTDTKRLKADVQLKAETKNVNFVKTLAPQLSSITIPPTTLQGRVTADGSRYTADVTARQGKGTVKAKGRYNGVTEDYEADVDIRQLNIKAMMPHDSLGTVTATARLKGRGFDLMKRNSLEADVNIEHLEYGQQNIDNVAAQATISDGHITATIDSDNDLLRGIVSADALLRSDVTQLQVNSGDMNISLYSPVSYERLLAQLQTLADTVVYMNNKRVIDQPALKRLLPTMELHASCRQNNLLSELLKKSMNTTFRDCNINLTTSPETGVNGTSYIYGLNYDSIQIDTITLSLKQRDERLTYQAMVCNTNKNPQITFKALIDGHLHEHGALAGLRYYDDKGRMGVRLGATAQMEEGGIRLQLMPERPTVGYKVFNLNKDNYIFLGRDKKIQAQIDLIADDNTGVKIYTENQDSTMLQDLTVSVNRLNMGELTSVVPYLPQITGYLNGDYHIVQDREERISVASDMSIESMTYEGSPIGNISSELTYLMRDDGSHAVEARLLLDDEEFGLLDGSLTPSASKDGESSIDATLTLTRLPLSLVNGFVPDKIIGLEGFAEGELEVKGKTGSPKVNGELMVDNAYLVSKPYGVRMRFGNDTVSIKDSRMMIEDFKLYAYNNEPLIMNGNIDFSNTDRMTMDMQMRARNMLLINSRQEPGSVAFGKAYVNFFARMQGPMESLRMRGRLDVLGSTDMTYMLLDSPLSVDNRMDELVKFTDFNDTTEVVVTRPAPSGLDADMTINVSQGARVLCNLNVDQTNYLDIMGGGNLRMRYNNEGINLTGRYTLTSGEMKYSLPIVPLKTFHIKDGSYVEFTGDPMNPTLNITATERNKTTVNDEGGTSRNVTFDCGVVITKTLNDMGLQFIIDAPEDQYINGELATMSAEERGKVAVTMLTTGMYLADGNTGSFSMNSALSSFLEKEINQIAGSALKTLDLQLGIENNTDAQGQLRTDYSFRFAKRFMNNRLTVQIGGKVSSGDNYSNGQQQSFFDNVTMEYRLNQEATQSLKLFYNQNVYDWLEGYTGEYGAGFVWRRKLDHFWDILKLKDSRSAPSNQSTRSNQNNQSSQNNQNNEK